MPGHWTDTFSYVTGTVRYADLAYVTLVDDAVAKDRVEHSFFLTWDAGQWRRVGGPTTWSIVSVCVCRQPLEQAVALGASGQVLCVGSGDVHEETIDLPDSSPRRRGPMRAIRSIGGKAYAVGMDRQVYRRDGVNLWTEVGHGARPSAGDPRIVGFEAVDGFSESEIYAVGWDGAIWRYDGSVWAEIDSPTNFVLAGVCCGGDGKVYACTRRGLLLRGRDHQWEVVEHGGTVDDFWGIAWYGEKLYLSSMRAVYVLVADQLQLVDMGADRPNTCFHLSTADGVLWSIGPKDVMAFDGTAWTRID